MRKASRRSLIFTKNALLGVTVTLPVQVAFFTYRVDATDAELATEGYSLNITYIAFFFSNCNKAVTIVIQSNIMTK